MKSAPNIENAPKSPYQRYIMENQKLLDTLSKDDQDDENLNNSISLNDSKISQSSNKSKQKSSSTTKSKSKKAENGEGEFYESLGQSLEAIGFKMSPNNSENHTSLNSRSNSKLGRSRNTNNSILSNGKNSKNYSKTFGTPSKNSQSRASKTGKNIHSNNQNSQNESFINRPKSQTPASPLELNSNKSGNLCESNENQQKTSKPLNLNENSQNTPTTKSPPISEITSNVLSLFKDNSPKENKQNESQNDSQDGPETPIVQKKQEKVFFTETKSSRSRKIRNLEKNDDNSSYASKTPNPKSKSSYSQLKSTINNSYVDYLEYKRQMIREKWAKEDQEYKMRLEEEEIDKFLAPKPSWKTFKFSPQKSNRANARLENNSDMNDSQNDSIFHSPIQSNSPSKSRMPPNPSNHLSHLMDIPIVERLLTPKKNLQNIDKDISMSDKRNSQRKTKGLYDDDFFTRQAQYENEKRRRNAKKQPKDLIPKKGEGKVFTKLFDQSIIDQFESSDQEEAQDNQQNKSKWTNNSSFWEPKKTPEKAPPIDTKQFRNDRFSPQSQLIAQKETRTFQQRSTIEFSDVIKKRQIEEEERKQREYYSEMFSD